MFLHLRRECTKFWFSVKLGFLGILPSLKASGILFVPELIVVVGKNVKYSHLGSYLQLSWAGTGSCWNSTICSSSRRGTILLLTKWKPLLKFRNIHIWWDQVPQQLKAFVLIFHKCFSVKTYNEFFIFKVKYSLVHEARGSFLELGRARILRKGTSSSTVPQYISYFLFVYSLLLVRIWIILQLLTIQNILLLVQI